MHPISLDDVGIGVRASQDEFVHAWRDWQLNLLVLNQLEPTETIARLTLVRPHRSAA
jgi:hypothetical protein